MNIAIVQLRQPDFGGISRVVQSWARMLSEAGHDVTFISQANDQVHDLGVSNVHSLLLPPRPDMARPDQPLAQGTNVAATVAELHGSGRVDLVISHSSVLTAPIRGRLPNVPILHTFHSPAVDEHYVTNWKYARTRRQRLAYPITRSVLRRFDRRALESITAAHTLSEYTWRLLRNRFPDLCRDIPSTRIPGTFNSRQFVPPVDRAKVRRELGIADDETILLTVRRLVPRNAVDRIVRAAAALRPQLNRTRFLIGGTGLIHEELETSIETAGLGDIIQMLGYIEEEQLAKYYQAADAFLLPTRDLECFGLPLIEAMGCGCAPLITPGGGPEETCRQFPERIAGENTTKAFTDLIASFLSGNIPKDIAGIDGWARERYSEDAVRPAVLDLVERVARS